LNRPFRQFRPEVLTSPEARRYRYQEHRYSPRREFGALITGINKTPIFRVFDHSNVVLKNDSSFTGFVRRIVVDDDYFGLRKVDLAQQRSQTLKRKLRFVKTGMIMETRILDSRLSALLPCVNVL